MSVPKMIIIGYRYCSWDMVCDRYNCSFSFWAIFCPFNPLTAWKMRISKKWKKKNIWRYHHFTQVYQKSWVLLHFWYPLRVRVRATVSVKLHFFMMNHQWAIPEKSKQGVEDIYTFLKITLEFFIFLLYSWKIQTKQSSTPRFSTNCVRTLGNSKAKNKNPWKFHIIFSWSPLGIPLHF